jgi:hypothetical protein
MLGYVGGMFEQEVCSEEEKWMLYAGSTTGNIPSAVSVVCLTSPVAEELH